MSKKGFLLIDGNYNTIFVPLKCTPELINLVDISKSKDWMKEVHKHKTRAELNKEISDYIKMEGYYNE